MSEKKFDLITHHRDTKSGRVSRKNPYKLHVWKTKAGETMQVYEREGKFFHADDSPAEMPEKLRKDRQAGAQSAK